MRTNLQTRRYAPKREPKAADAKRPMNINAQLLTAAHMCMTPDLGVKGIYKLPELPPGVVPAPGKLAMDTLCLGETPRATMAMDNYGPAWAWGSQTGLNQYGAGLWFPGYPYLSELTQISEYRAPSETISTEVTRKWLKFVSKSGQDQSDKIAQLTARWEELKVKELAQRCALLDGEFGRSQIYLNINDADEIARQLPLDISPAGIPKGSLKSLACIEPYWTTPYSWNAACPERADFYKPTSWYIMGRKTHSTRMLTFIGREVPDLLKPAYNFGGISLSQLMSPYINRWLRTAKAVNDLINNFSLLTLHTDLAVTLQDGESEGSGLIARLQAFQLFRNNQAVNVVQKDSELLEFCEATLASLDKLQAQAQEHMAAPAHIPLVKLFGTVPTGLNATSEGEIQIWYDWISAYQVHFFGVNFEILHKVIQCDVFGAIDDDILIHWIELDQPTGKELSEIRKSDADMDIAYINASVISPEEARERIKDDPESGYNNLSGPAPEPQMLDEFGNPLPEGAEPPQPGDGEEDDEDEDAPKPPGKKEPAVPIRAKTSG